MVRAGADWTRPDYCPPPRGRFYAGQDWLPRLFRSYGDELAIYGGSRVFRKTSNRELRNCYETFRQISRGRILLLRVWEEWKGKIRDEFNFVIRNKSFLSHFLSFADLWILNSGFCFAWFVAPSVKQRSFVFEKRFQSLKIVKRFGREELYFIERAEKG